LDKGWITGVKFLAGAGIIHLCHPVQSGFDAHPIGTEGSFPRG